MYLMPPAIADLGIHDYGGRYIISRKVEKHILSLDKRLVNQANSIKLSLFPVSALDCIDNERDAKLFKERVYPLEIAKEIFPDKDYRILEVFLSIDEIKWKSKTGDFGMIEMELSPQILCNWDLNYAFNSVYSVVFREDSKKVQDIKRIWRFE